MAASRDGTGLRVHDLWLGSATTDGCARSEIRPRIFLSVLTPVCVSADKYVTVSTDCQS